MTTFHSHVNNSTSIDSNLMWKSIQKRKKIIHFPCDYLQITSFSERICSGIYWEITARLNSALQTIEQQKHFELIWWIKWKVSQRNPETTTSMSNSLNVVRLWSLLLKAVDSRWWSVDSRSNGRSRHYIIKSTNKIKPKYTSQLCWLTFYCKWTNSYPSHGTQTRKCPLIHFGCTRQELKGPI